MCVPHSVTSNEFFRVYDLKAALQGQTNVPPERQKILGLVKGKLPPDEVTMYVIFLLFLIIFLSRSFAEAI